MELFETVPAYSWLFFIFANTEIYAEKYKIRRNVKMTFDKFFRCIAQKSLEYRCKSDIVFFSWRELL